MDLFTVIFLVIGCPFSVLIMFLPTLIELKRPIDAGPRMILEDYDRKSIIQTIAGGKIMQKREFGIQGKTLAGVLNILPDIEI